MGAWGRWMAPRGFWLSLNESGVAGHTQVPPLRYVGEQKITWRGSYDVQGAARLKPTV